MLGCSWGPQGLGEAAQGRGRLLSSMKDAPGDIGHPHLEGTEASPLPSAEPFKSFGLVGQSLSFSLGSPGWERVTWHSSGASQPAVMIMGWGMDLGTPVPLVQLCRQVGDAAGKP